MNERILIVEDEEALRMMLFDRLQSEGYSVNATGDGVEGLVRAMQGAFDLILLDLMLPEKGGADICREIRRSGLTTPVIILTARGQTRDKIAGFKLGADDYVTKPFEMVELVARMEAVLRRVPNRQVAQSVYRFGSLRIDLRGTEVSREGKIVNLPAREFQLLRYLLEHQGATISREELLRDVWCYSTESFTRTVDVHILSLRQKLEKDPKHPELIVTVPGLGYKFIG